MEINRKTENFCKKGFAVPWVQAPGVSNVDFKAKNFSALCMCVCFNCSTFEEPFIEEMVSNAAWVLQDPGVVHLDLWTFPGVLFSLRSRLWYHLHSWLRWRLAGTQLIPSPLMDTCLISHHMFFIEPAPSRAYAQILEQHFVLLTPQSWGFWGVWYTGGPRISDEEVVS